MIFEKELISFDILDVLELKQKNISMSNVGRNFDALSFRFRADTYLKTESEEYHAGDNSVCFVPARLDYTRNSVIDELIVVHFNTSNYRSGGIELYTPNSPERLARFFKELLRLWNEKEIGYKHRCTAVVYEILAECYADNYKPASDGSKIERSLAYIEDNYKNHDLTVGRAAEKSFISEVYFRRLCKEKMGISPQQYIIKLRIQNAVALISTGYYTLKEVAYMSGYNDYKYFSAEFKRITGVSPSEYSYNFIGK